MRGEGGKWWEGENKNNNKTEKKKKKGGGGWGREGKNSEAGLFLSSLPSIQCQQGRSTTVASHGAQKNLTSVF